MSTPFQVKGFEPEEMRGDSAIFRFGENTVAITPAPHYPEITNGVGIVREIMLAAAEFVKKRDLADKDKGLTPIGRERVLGPLREKAEAIIATGRDKLESYELIWDRKAAESVAPKKLDPTDAVEVAIDREIRDWIRSRQANFSGDIIEEARTNSRILEAAMRSPISFGMVGDSLAEMWRARVAPNNPDLILAKKWIDVVKWAREQIYWIEKQVETTPADGVTITHRVSAGG